MKDLFGERGYAVAEAVLSRQEVAALIEAVEEVCAEVTEHATRAGAGPEVAMENGHRIQFSSRTAIQWEWSEGSQAIRLVEPADHLHPRIAALFDDPRLTGPAAEALGDARVAPFTSKLNFKRAVEGSPFPWHQDYPYWYVAVGEDAHDIVTAVVFLDDATEANGALRVIPGSHRTGPVRRDRSDRFLADPSAVDGAAEVVVEVPAGSVLWFGSLLVHRSSPNTTGSHRRALLPSWQPVGRPRLHDVPYLRERVDELP